MDFVNANSPLRMFVYFLAWGIEKCKFLSLGLLQVDVKRFQDATCPIQKHRKLLREESLTARTIQRRGRNRRKKRGYDSNLWRKMPIYRIRRKRKRELRSLADKYLLLKNNLKRKNILALRRGWKWQRCLTSRKLRFVNFFS